MSELESWLVEDGLLTAAQLEHARQHATESGAPLPIALIELDLVVESDLVRLMSARYQLPPAPYRLYKASVPAKALSFIPQDLCWQHGVFPFDYDRERRALKVAIFDPDDPEAHELVARISGAAAELYVIGPRQLEKAIRKHYLDSWIEETQSERRRKFVGYDQITHPGAASPLARMGRRTRTAETPDEDGGPSPVPFSPPTPTPPQSVALKPEPAVEDNQGRARGDSRAPRRRRSPSSNPPGRRRATAIGRVGASDDLERRLVYTERALLRVIELLSDRADDELRRELERTAKLLSPGKG